MLKDSLVIGYARSKKERVAPATGWTLDTRVNLASVSKPITAVAVLTLVEEQRMSLSDPFTKYVVFRDTPQGASRVTIRDLLRMRSGLPPDDTLESDLALTEYLRGYLSRGPVAEPGIVYQYSNANFSLLQRVIETIADESYESYVTKAVLLPMEIDPTIFSVRPDNRVHATLGYSGADDLRPGQYWADSGFHAAAGWIASASELLKFLTGIRRSTLLSGSLTRRMFTEGLGWYRRRVASGIAHYHDGEFVNDQDQWITTIAHVSATTDEVLLTNSPAGAEILSEILRNRVRGSET
jgi:CubicO group peptidase (beta-lactamase class C family)